jgi:hypothetical protein
MSDSDDKVNLHTTTLVNATLKIADQRDRPLPEDEVAKLGMVIATERQLLIDAMSELLSDYDGEAAAVRDVAAFDAGFVYGMAFARAIDDARIAVDRLQRGRLLTLVTKPPKPAAS